MDSFSLNSKKWQSALLALIELLRNNKITNNLMIFIMNSKLRCKDKPNSPN